MYIENDLTATLPSAHQTKSIVRNSQGFDLDSLISILKNDKKWKKGEMNSMILLRNSSRSVVLVILHEKTEIKSTLIQNPVNFQIIEGQLKVHSPKKDHDLRSGETLTLNESKFRIDSVKETAFLMTLKS